VTREREVKYRVYWTKTAVRDLRRLDRRLAERIIDSVEEASLNPLRYFKKLRGLPFYSLRIGDYRVLVSLDHSRRTLVVLVVEHRRRAYRRARTK